MSFAGMYLPNIHYLGLVCHYTDIVSNGIHARIDKLKASLAPWTRWIKDYLLLRYTRSLLLLR
jgi:hypothetical protein